MKKNSSRKKTYVLNAPSWSSCVYVRIDASKVHMFRFLLEAEDNLGIMTVVDRWGAILKVRFSPHQESAVLLFIQGIKETVLCSLIDVPKKNENLEGRERLVYIASL